MKPRRMATEAEKAYIAEHYATGKTSDIAQALKMSPDMVRGFAQKLGIRKRAAYSRDMSYCTTCCLNARGRCIYGNEGDAGRCKAMRYSTAKWPKLMTRTEIARAEL